MLLGHNRKILIAGGSGWLGTHLTKLLLKRDYQVAWLSRNAKLVPRVARYQWDPENGTIDNDAFANTDVLINLSGQSLATRRWSAKRKKELYDSRIKSSSLLADGILKSGHNLKCFIQISAIGYYGNRGNEILSENSSNGKDFIAGLVRDWESIVKHRVPQEVRKVTYRLGPVLDPTSVYYKGLQRGILKNIATLPGSGNQYQSWIYLPDVVQAFMFAIENQELNGTFNLVASEPVILVDLVRTVFGYNSNLKFVRIPPFVLRIVLGQLSELVLSSTRVSNSQIKQAGFNFQYGSLNQLKDELSKVVN